MVESKSLTERLAEVLPKGFTFKIYHLSTPPTKTAALFSAPPKTRPDRTYCESNYLTVSIDAPAKTSTAKDEESVELLVYAIEVLIYSTASTTTLFVSKADSTGYLHLLNLPKGTPSPIKTISSTFLEYLVQTRRRTGIRTIVSLFARAQDQYLFPGSIENEGKHVLDDRGLVKWWCRVLDPIIIKSSNSTACKRSQPQSWSKVKGYLLVPGSDSAHLYLPTEAKIGAKSEWRWEVGHPLGEISRHPSTVPPRCLIPRFPDDPKARYLDDLDDELKGRAANGQWASMKTVEQFWDAMAFRQECSAGRMVGFLWIVFTPREIIDRLPLAPRSAGSQNTDSQGTVKEVPLPLVSSSYTEAPSSPGTSFMPSSQTAIPSSPTNPLADDFLSNSQRSIASTCVNQTPRKKLRKKKKLSGPIIPRRPRVKTKNSLHVVAFPAITPYYSCPSGSRGQVVLAEKDYKRATELLIRLDFADESLASQSSSRWISEVRSGVASNEDPWGVSITGTLATEVKAHAKTAAVNSLNTGLVRKKRKPDSQDVNETIPTASLTPAVNMLGSGLVRKKPKT